MPGAMMHFEIYAEEPAVLAEFYGELFGWRLECGPRPKLADRHRRSGAARHSRRADLLACRRRSQLGPYVHVASLDDAVADVSGSAQSCCGRDPRCEKTAWYAVLADPEGNISDLPGRRRGVRAGGDRNITDVGTVLRSIPLVTQSSIMCADQSSKRKTHVVTERPPLRASH